MDKHKTYTISVLRANLAALFISVPISAIGIVPFVLIWPLEKLSKGVDFMLIWAIPIILVGVVLHEFLHGFTWSIFAKNGWRAIKFGLKWSSLTPYCHCKEPLLKPYYVLGTFMPLFVLGIVPLILGNILGNGAILIFGILFSIGAGGDIYGLLVLRKTKRTDWIQDHPEEIGFIVIDR